MGEIVVREYELIEGLNEEERTALTHLTQEEHEDAEGRPWRALSMKGGHFKATNYVGILEAGRSTSVVILPKVDLADAGDEKREKAVFLKMLRDWRGVRDARFPEASIADLKKFEMWEVFYYLFLQSVVRLAQRGLARRYRTVEDNLPFLRGRIHFPEHIRRNAVNRARFFVGYDEFSADRPANRLIRTALDRLTVRAKHPRNRQLLHGLLPAFAEIPLSTQPEVDWERRLVDRSMRHYDEVLSWVCLLLFRGGLATFAGEHRNRALLFPMEQVFEDFVTASFRRHQEKFGVRDQGPRKHLVEASNETRLFYMKPDISLVRRDSTLREQRVPAFILDAKWKRLTAAADHPKRGISQSDLYQLFAYGKKYGVPEVALIYPKSEKFSEALRFRFDPDLSLVCYPFDVEKPRESVNGLLDLLEPPETDAKAA